MFQRIKTLSYALMLITGSNPRCDDCGRQIMIRNGDGPNYQIVTTRCDCSQCESVFDKYAIAGTRDFGSMPNSLLELHRMASRGFGPARVSALACEFTPVPQSIKVMRMNYDGEIYFVVSLGKDYEVGQSLKKRDPRELANFIKPDLGTPFSKPYPIFTDELDDVPNLTYNGTSSKISTYISTSTQLSASENAVKWTERLIETIEEKRRQMALQALAEEAFRSRVESGDQKKPAAKPAPAVEDAPRKITWD